MLPLRLGVLAAGEPSDIRTWSGVPYFMTNALRPHFRDVIYLPAGDLSFSAAGMRVDRWSRRIFGRGYLPGHGRRGLADKARTIDRLAAEQNIDVLFAITVDELVAFLDSPVPLVHHSDTTFALMEGYYPSYSSLWQFCRKRGNEYTARALDRADLSIFPSRWAARSAIDDYGADPEKVHVIPYGANITEEPSVQNEAPSAHDASSCQLLFLGSNWIRKGGPTVYAAFLELIERGVDANLVVVGCNPPHTHDKLEVLPFLNKQMPEDLERYKKIWREAAFLFMPSQQETFGAVFAEAAANSVPVISAQTGGVADAVQDGVSGYLLAEDAQPDAYADVIEQAWADPAKYERLRIGARQRYEQVLNWNVWAERTANLVEALFEHKK